MNPNDRIEPIEIDEQQPTRVEKELAALARCVEVFETLDARAQQRALRYLNDILDASGVQVGLIQRSPHHRRIIIRLPAVPLDAAADVEPPRHVE